MSPVYSGSAYLGQVTWAGMDPGHRATCSWPRVEPSVTPVLGISFVRGCGCCLWRDLFSMKMFPFDFQFIFNCYPPITHPSILFSLLPTPCTPPHFLFSSLKPEDLFPAWNLCLDPLWLPAETSVWEPMASLRG